MTPGLVVFDLDGTLVDSQHVIVSSMTAAFEELREPPPSREEILAIVGLSLVEAAAALMPNRSRTKHEQLAVTYRRCFLKIRSTGEFAEVLFPGARQAVEALADMPHLTLGIATGKSRRGVQGVLAHHELEGHFGPVQTADDAPSKPHPAMLKNVMDATGVDANRTLFIGDTTFDMEMAGHAGVRGLGVTWGYHNADALAAAGAHQLVSSFEAIPALVVDLLETSAAKVDS